MTQPLRLHHLFLAMLGFAALPCAFAGELEGTVLDQDGKPVANALVAAEPWDNQYTADGHIAQHLGRTDGKGHFLIPDLPAASYGATATATGLGPAFLANVKITDTGRLAGQVLRLGGPAVLVQGTLQTSTAAALPAGTLIRANRISDDDGDVFYGESEAGHFDLKLAPGHYRLRGMAPGWESLPQELVLAANDTPAQRQIKLLPERGSNPALSKELNQMEVEDQKVRYDWMQHQDDAHTDAMIKVDQKNEARIEEIIKQQGWPDANLVGPLGVNSLWLLVQHQSPALIKQCLPDMKAAADRGELPWSTVALSIDRDLMNDGKKQLYGSQVTKVEKGVAELYPVEDEAHLDERRAKVGLGPIAEYKAQMVRMMEPAAN